jgi:hypothetical protein
MIGSPCTHVLSHVFSPIPPPMGLGREGMVANARLYLGRQCDGIAVPGLANDLDAKLE